MNFDEIKDVLNEDVAKDEKQVVINFKSSGNNPIAMIRSNMKKEIWTQLLVIIIFFIYPRFIPMEAFSKSVYYVFMFITAMMTMGYIIKLAFFLRGTAKLEWNTRDALLQFVFDAKLTLEVYKSFIIAGSLLLPIPISALLLGNKMAEGQLLFEKWFLLNISSVELVILIVSYLVIAFLFYYTTLFWANLMYGKHLKMLQNRVDELAAD